MKHEIYRFEKLNPGLKQADLIEVFSKQFKFDIYLHQLHMSDILKQKTKDKINISEEYFKPVYDDIDKCSFSIGWLAGFKKRFKVSRQTIIGESKMEHGWNKFKENIFP